MRAEQPVAPLSTPFSLNPSAVHGSVAEPLMPAGSNALAVANRETVTGNLAIVNPKGAGAKPLLTRSPFLASEAFLPRASTELVLSDAAQLVKAAAQGDANKLRTLLNNSLRHDSSLLVVALRLAVANGHEQVIAMLLAKIPPPELARYEPLRMVTDAVSKGCETNAMLILEHLVKAGTNGASSRSATAESGSGALLELLPLAAAKGLVRVTAHILGKGPSHPSVSEKIGEALLAATENRQVATIALLLKEIPARANPQYRIRDALRYAAKNEHEDSVALLLGAIEKSYASQLCLDLPDIAAKGYVHIFMRIKDVVPDGEELREALERSLGAAAAASKPQMAEELLNIVHPVAGNTRRYIVNAVIPAIRGGNQGLLKRVIETVSLHGDAASGDPAPDLVNAIAEAGNLALMADIVPDLRNSPSKPIQLSPAIAVAARHGHETMVAMLLDELGGAALLSDDIQVALSSAAWIGHQGIVKRLLERMTGNAQRRSVLSSTIASASKAGHEGLVAMLLDALDGDELEPYALEMAFLTAIKCGPRSILLQSLERFSKQLKSQSTLASLIAAASKAGNLKIVEMLLDKLETDEDRNASLIEAIYLAQGAGHRDTARILLEKLSRIACDDEVMNRVVIAASRLGSSSVVTQMLKRGLSEETLASALEQASAFGHRDLVHLLLDQLAYSACNADVRCRALISAVKERQSETVRLLLDASPSMPLDNRNSIKLVIAATLVRDFASLSVLLARCSANVLHDDASLSTIAELTEARSYAIRRLLEIYHPGVQTEIFARLLGISSAAAKDDKLLTDALFQLMISAAKSDHYDIVELLLKNVPDRTTFPAHRLDDLVCIPNLYPLLWKFERKAIAIKRSEIPYETSSLIAELKGRNLSHLLAWLYPAEPVTATAQKSRNTDEECTDDAPMVAAPLAGSTSQAMTSSFHAFIANPSDLFARLVDSITSASDSRPSSWKAWLAAKGVADAVIRQIARRADKIDTVLAAMTGNQHERIRPALSEMCWSGILADLDQAAASSGLSASDTEQLRALASLGRENEARLRDACSRLDEVCAPFLESSGFMDAVGAYEELTGSHGFAGPLADRVASAYAFVAAQQEPPGTKPSSQAFAARLKLALESKGYTSKLERLAQESGNAQSFEMLMKRQRDLLQRYCESKTAS